MFRSQIKPAILVFLALTVITGVLYPLFITVMAQMLFYDKANGSLIYENGKAIGSVLIGQPFDDPQYFWGRPSSTSPLPFNAAASSGSNSGPSNPALIDSVKARIMALKTADPTDPGPVPVDLITSSASGLDPHISLAAAYYQVPRVARLRGLPQETVRSIVHQHACGRFLGLAGEPVVNVLELNLSLDACGKKK
jgi:potassium-transporting ATPase KdpC subunit